MSKPKINKGTRCAIVAIETAMRRNCINLVDMHSAMNIIVDHAIAQEIMRLRSKGDSIRKIARHVHMDDRRVSAIIKKAEKPCKRRH